LINNEEDKDEKNNIHSSSTINTNNNNTATTTTTATNNNNNNNNTSNDKNKEMKRITIEMENIKQMEKTENNIITSYLAILIGCIYMNCDDTTKKNKILNQLLNYNSYSSLLKNESKEMNSNSGSNNNNNNNNKNNNYYKENPIPIVLNSFLLYQSNTQILTKDTFHSIQNIVNQFNSN
jgi:hypothetical protein